MISTLDLDTLDRFAAGTPEGPWHYCDAGAVGRKRGDYVVHDSDPALPLAVTRGGTDAPNIAAFIAAARTAVPVLTAAVRERDAEIARYRAGKTRVAAAHEHDIKQTRAVLLDEMLGLTRTNADLHAELARYRDALRGLVDALPKCDACGSPATRAFGCADVNESRFCDAEKCEPRCFSAVIPDRPGAAALRTAIALLDPAKETER